MIFLASLLSLGLALPIRDSNSLRLVALTLSRLESESKSGSKKFSQKYLVRTVSGRKTSNPCLVVRNGSTTTHQPMAVFNNIKQITTITIMTTMLTMGYQLISIIKIMTSVRMDLSVGFLIQMIKALASVQYDVLWPAIVLHAHVEGFLKVWQIRL